MKDFFSDGLYDTALLEPVKSGARFDKLLIVSGYASSAMAFHHLDELRRLEKLVPVNLIYGMIKSDGITRSNHKGFQELSQNTFKDYFSCKYLVKGEPVHAKVYIWCREGNPVLAYAGSANYTQMAFLNSKRREVLAPCNPVKAFEFFTSLHGDTLECTNPKVNREITSFNRFDNSTPVDFSNEDGKINVVSDKASPYYGLEKATISLLDRTGEVPKRSGLNWGQREELHREPNQAYFSVRGELKKSDFFPPRGIYFTVLTDDNQIIQCVRAQDDAKAIHTPHDNSEIGRYIRTRAGIPLGAMVTAKDLVRYGRTSVDFYKIDNENYYMDFSVKK